MAKFANFSLHLFDDSDFQMESSASFPETDATDSLKTRKNNQIKNTQRSRKTWIKVFDLWHAEQSEVRKLDEIQRSTSLMTFFADFMQREESKMDAV